MNEIGPYIAPALALYFIIRRGSRPRRVRPNALWTFPVIITLLCATTMASEPVPSLTSFVLFALALPAGAALGWFTAQHVELTLDAATGTIMSKATAFGTALTASAFVARFGLELLMNGGTGKAAHFAGQHSGTLVGAADALLLFVAARGLASASHMWVRTRPLLEQHKASKAPS